MPTKKQCKHVWSIVYVEPAIYMPNKKTGIHETKGERVYFNCRNCTEIYKYEVRTDSMNFTWKPHEPDYDKVIEDIFG
jgi:hypothetical protein